MGSVRGAARKGGPYRDLNFFLSATAGSSRDTLTSRRSAPRGTPGFATAAPRVASGLRGAADHSGAVRPGCPGRRRGAALEQLAQSQEQVRALAGAGDYSAALPGPLHRRGAPQPAACGDRASGGGRLTVRFQVLTGGRAVSPTARLVWLRIDPRVGLGDGAFPWNGTECRRWSEVRWCAW